MHHPVRPVSTPLGALLLIGAMAIGVLAARSAHAGDLEGVRWKVIAAERAGKPNPAELDAILSFEGGTLALLSPAGEKVEFEYTLDRSQEPAHVDLTRGKNDKRLTLHGIWKVENDRFTLCLGAPFEDRPTEFAAADGQQTSLTVHERISD